MKTLKYNIIVALGCCFCFLSCLDGFLDTESKTDVLDENFYETIADLEMALIGCYDGYQRTVSNGNKAFIYTAELLSDNCFGGTGTSDYRDYQAIDRFDLSQFPSDANFFEGLWIDYYAGIYRCNVLLQQMEGFDREGNETALNRIEGETRFLRAMMYFELVRLFENVPLLTVPSADNLPQADPVDVYKQIVEDFKYAAENISATAYPKANASDNDGRITPYAAKAMLARVYLFYSGYYGASDIGLTQAEALSGLEDIISSDEYWLEDDFAALWPAASYVPNHEDNTLDRSRYSGEGNREIIFSQKFNNTSNYNGDSDGNASVVMYGLRNKPYSPYGTGWGGSTVNPELVRAYPAGDLRREASIIDIEGEGIGVDNIDISDQREYTGYFVKKYAPTAFPDGTDNVGGEQSFMLSQDQDYFIIRYADVLLMAAELGSSNAVDHYNKVRIRAGLSTKASITIDDIMEERRLEFAFEGIRYWDLLRQGVNVAANTIATEQTLLSGGVPDVVTISAGNIIKTRGFMQIPGNQITMSANLLKQNEGW